MNIQQGKFIILLIGLGNPGPKYINTRHNSGEIVLKSLEKYMEKLPITMRKSPNVLLINNREYHFLYNPDLINICGPKIKKYMIKYNIPKDKIIIFHDDLKVTPGKIKYKYSYGTEGHNGLRSINKALGGINPITHRVRVGIGYPVNNQDISDYVLDKIEDPVLHIFQNIPQEVYEKIIHFAHSDE